MWLYRLLLLVATPLILIRMRLFKKSDRRYRVKEALGFWKSTKADLWIHCASVGEVLAVRSLVTQWQEKYPTKFLLITTMTPTGAQQVGKVFPLAQHRYLPMDWRYAVKLVFKRLDCKQLIIVEMELWPNLLIQAKKCGVAVSIINARMSERSFRRYKRLSIISKPLMRLPDAFLTHAQADADRFVSLGAKQVQVTGSIKFDLAVSEEVFVDNWYAKMTSSFVWVAGSTHKGEDEILLRVHRRLMDKIPDALLVIVPRHPERFAFTYELAQADFDKVTFKSAITLPQWTNFNVIVGDTMGELMHYYHASDLAFVGGSLIRRGGHNPIEPALLGKSILVGPHTFNFADITDRLIKADGAIRCRDEARLAEVVVSLSGKAGQRRCLGQAALRFAQQNQGAVIRVLSEIDLH